MQQLSPPTRRKAPPEERRAQILAAAWERFGDQGYHPTTMDDIARASGLSKGSLYWYFESKEEVFLALIDAYAEELFAAWDAIGQGESNPVTALEQIWALSAERIASERHIVLAWLEFMSHPVARERMARIYATSREKLAAIIRRGVQRGEIRAVSPESVAAVVTGAGEGLFLQLGVDPEFDPRDHVPTLVDILRGGLAP